jgi:hypothetical protein
MKYYAFCFVCFLSTYFPFYFYINQVWFLVKTMSEPLTDPHKKYANGNRVQGKMMRTHSLSYSRNPILGEGYGAMVCVRHN